MGCLEKKSILVARKVFLSFVAQPVIARLGSMPAADFHMHGVVTRLSIVW
jgi:hypothetical protein